MGLRACSYVFALCPVDTLLGVPPADGLRLQLEESYSEVGCIFKLRLGVSLTDAIASDAW